MSVFFLAILTVFALGWFATAVPLVRRRIAMDSYGSGFCHGRTRSQFRDICRQFHGSECWRAELERPAGRVDALDVGAASLQALAWPLLLLPFVVYLAATRKPARLSADALARRIADLERENLP